MRDIFGGEPEYYSFTERDAVEEPLEDPADSTQELTSDDLIELRARPIHGMLVIGVRLANRFRYFSDFAPRSTFYPPCHMEAAVTAIGRARYRVSLLAYAYDHPAIHERIVLAHRSGVSVVVIVDYWQVCRSSTRVAERLLDLIHNGIEVRLWRIDALVGQGFDKSSERHPNGKSGITSAMHAKQCLIDNGVVVGGSMNWTENSANNNLENPSVSQYLDEVAAACFEHHRIYIESQRSTPRCSSWESPGPEGERL